MSADNGGATRKAWGRELAAWIADPDQGQAALRGAMLKEILDTFRAEGIEIPFPQRDVRLYGPAASGVSP